MAAVQAKGWLIVRNTRYSPAQLNEASIFAANAKSMLKNKKEMNIIIQEEETGCGIASIANIVELPYTIVKAKANSMGIFANDDKLYSDTEYVRNLLNEYGLQASSDEIEFTSWKALPNIALLSIKYYEEDGRPFWHWVVFKRVQGADVVLDSAAYLDNNERTDFQNMEPKWFIEVLTT